jgi:TonB family protein
VRRSISSIFIVIIAVAIAVGTLAPAQNVPAPGNSERKVALRVPAVYPDLAKKMHMHGTVRIEAVVRANGTVKSTRVLGGNPVLADAAMDAVAKWKFESAQNETTEVVPLAFEAH